MLSALDRSILDFERAWTTMIGPKDKEIELTLGLTSENYYERLSRMLFEGRADCYDPLTVRRLQLMVEGDPSLTSVG
jgi:hypothetical protein